MKHKLGFIFLLCTMVAVWITRETIDADLLQFGLQDAPKLFKAMIAITLCTITDAVLIIFALAIAKEL